MLAIAVAAVLPFAGPVAITEEHPERQPARTEAAADALMGFYNQETGLWDTTGWWNSANAMTAMLDYWTRTGTAEHREAIANTFEKNGADDFTNEYLDDTGWWGLAWVRAYDLTGEQRYLEMAERTAAHMNDYRDDVCGGGVWWRTDKTYKNAVTNELFIKLSASLHNRIPGDTAHLQRAQETWQWFQDSGMINQGNLINDGLELETCQNNGDTTWTYNQGIILGALVELSEATGDAGLLDRARELADASSSAPALNPHGILREPCEDGDCGGDGPSFKGVYARNLGELDRSLDGRPYQDYLRRQVETMNAKNRNDANQFGLHWNGPFDSADAARQHSALDAHVAAL